MRLLRTDIDLDNPVILNFNDERDLPPYSILSHTWLRDHEEVSFQDLRDANIARSKLGWEKLQFTLKQAHADGIRYAWIDTCCIDKSSSAELAEAINSMYRWYCRAEVCYVYLADVTQSLDQCDSSEDDAFAHSRWFTRGWTLQEILAPRRARFYCSMWQDLGTLDALARRISAITGINEDLLRRKRSLESYSIAQRMSWASRRTTTREEDSAYSLLGIFGVNMPIIYGEGARAFARLQEELLRQTTDQSIFAWEHSIADPQPGPCALLAPSPSCFAACGDIVPLVGDMLDYMQVTYDVISLTLPVVTFPYERHRWPHGNAVLQCAFGSNPAKAIALNIQRLSGNGHTGEAFGDDNISVMNVNGLHLGPSCRLSIFDRLDVEAEIKMGRMKMATQKMNLLRQPVHWRTLPVNQAGDYVHTMIILRIEDPARLDICAVHPARAWSDDRNTLTLDNREPVARVTIKYHQADETSITFSFEQSSSGSLLATLEMLPTRPWLIATSGAGLSKNPDQSKPDIHSGSLPLSCRSPLRDGAVLSATIETNMVFGQNIPRLKISIIGKKRWLWMQLRRRMATVFFSWESEDMNIGLASVFANGLHLSIDRCLFSALTAIVVVLHGSDTIILHILAVVAWLAINYARLVPNTGTSSAQTRAQGANSWIAVVDCCLLGYAIGVLPTIWSCLITKLPRPVKLAILTGIGSLAAIVAVVFGAAYIRERANFE